MLGERLQYILYKDHSTWGQFIDRNNAYHTVCVPSSFRSIHYGGSWGPSTHTSLCVCLKCCPPVTRQAGETADGQQPGVGGGVGGWGEGSSAGGGRGKAHGQGGGLVAFVAFPSVSAASVMRSTSHVKVVTFSGWEPHGVHQAHG